MEKKTTAAVFTVLRVWRVENFPEANGSLYFSENDVVKMVMRIYGRKCGSLEGIYASEEGFEFWHDHKGNAVLPGCGTSGTRRTVLFKGKIWYPIVNLGDKLVAVDFAKRLFILLSAEFSGYSDVVQMMQIRLKKLDVHNVVFMSE